MKAAERRMIIFKMLEEQTTVEVRNLAESLNVSTMTIRRDLAHFEKQGLIVTNYGGAYLNRSVGVEPSFALKQGQKTEEKQYIAREAASLVKDNDSIVLDCGSTPLHMIKFLLKKKITVITNSLPVVNNLHRYTKIKLVVAPGEYNYTSAGVISNMTMNFFYNLYADIVFMSAQGFCIERGATVPCIEDANVKRSIINSAKIKVLLVDHAKLGKSYLARYAETTDFDIIITDDRIEPAYYNKLLKVCNKVLVAGEDELSND